VAVHIGAGVLTCGDFTATDRVMKETMGRTLAQTGILQGHDMLYISTSSVVYLSSRNSTQSQPQQRSRPKHLGPAVACRCR
jgi:hypothetical protein